MRSPTPQCAGGRPDGARFARLPDPDQPQPAPSTARHADQTEAGAGHTAGTDDLGGARSRVWVADQR